MTHALFSTLALHLQRPNQPSPAPLAPPLAPLSHRKHLHPQATHHRRQTRPFRGAQPTRTSGAAPGALSSQKSAGDARTRPPPSRSRRPGAPSPFATPGNRDIFERKHTVRCQTFSVMTAGREARAAHARHARRVRRYFNLHKTDYN